MKISVILQDIAKVPCDVLVTSIDQGGGWFTKTDEDILTASGNMFHGQAHEAKPLTYGQVIVAKNTGEHGGAFHHVIFVVVNEDLHFQNTDIVFNGLKAAAEEGFRTVAIPVAILYNSVTHPVPSTTAAMTGLYRALHEFGDRLDMLMFVYGKNDPPYCSLLIGGINQIGE